MADNNTYTSKQNVKKYTTQAVIKGNTTIRAILNRKRINFKRKPPNEDNKVLKIPLNIII